MDEFSGGDWGKEPNQDGLATFRATQLSRELQKGIDEFMVDEFSGGEWGKEPNQHGLGTFRTPTLRRGRFSIEGQPSLSQGAFFSFDEEWLERSAVIWEIGDPDYAKECRKQARFIARLRNDEDPLRERLVKAFLREQAKMLPAIFFLAPSSQAASGALRQKAVAYCDYLAALAERGHGQALETLARIAIAATRRVNRLADKMSVSLAPLATEEIAWPVMKSKHPKFGDDEQAIFKKLPIGAAFAGLQPTKRFEATDGFGHVAWQLQGFVARLRDQVRAHAKEHRIKLDGLKWDPLRMSLEELAVLLPDFGPDRAVLQRWWTVAQKCLVEAYPHPCKPGKLNESIPCLNRLVTAQSHRTSPGRIRTKLLERLKRKFVTFAGGAETGA